VVTRRGSLVVRVLVASIPSAAAAVHPRLACRLLRSSRTHFHLTKGQLQRQVKSPRLPACNFFLTLITSIIATRDFVLWACTLYYCTTAIRLPNLPSVSQSLTASRSRVGACIWIGLSPVLCDITYTTSITRPVLESNL